MIWSVSSPLRGWGLGASPAVIPRDAVGSLRWGVNARRPPGRNRRQRCSSLGRRSLASTTATQGTMVMPNAHRASHTHSPGGCSVNTTTAATTLITRMDIIRTYRTSRMRS